MQTFFKKSTPCLFLLQSKKSAYFLVNLQNAVKHSLELFPNIKCKNGSDAESVFNEIQHLKWQQSQEKNFIHNGTALQVWNQGRPPFP